MILRTSAHRMFAALAALVFVACSNGSGGVAAPTSLATDQTLRFPIQGDVTTLDPAMIQSDPEAQLAHNIFDGLLRFDGNLNVVPDIAESMPTITADGLTYTFKLRQDVTFSNGDKVTLTCVTEIGPRWTGTGAESLMEKSSPYPLATAKTTASP